MSLYLVLHHLQTSNDYLEFRVPTPVFRLSQGSIDHGVHLSNNCHIMGLSSWLDEL